MSLGKWDICAWYLPRHCGTVLKAMWDMASATSQWNSIDMNFQPRVWFNTTGRYHMLGIVTLGYVGHLCVIFAISLRSCTEGHGYVDFTSGICDYRAAQCCNKLCHLASGISVSGICHYIAKQY